MYQPLNTVYTVPFLALVSRPFLSQFLAKPVISNCYSIYKKEKTVVFIMVTDVYDAKLIFEF